MSNPVLSPEQLRYLPTATSQKLTKLLDILNTAASSANPVEITALLREARGIIHEPQLYTVDRISTSVVEVWRCGVQFAAFYGTSANEDAVQYAAHKNTTILKEALNEAAPPNEAQALPLRQ